MSEVERLLVAIERLAEERAYIARTELLEVGRLMLKARLYFEPGLFVQVYRNDKFYTTSFALIHGERRIYGRDELGGVWHRHTVSDPDLHDVCTEGRRAVTLDEFMDEMEQVVMELDLV